jgi:hypothetical protein
MNKFKTSFTDRKALSLLINNSKNNIMIKNYCQKCRKKDKYLIYDTIIKKTFCRECFNEE